MSRRRAFVAMAIVGVVLTGGGIAAALWSANGSGPGQAKALSAQSLTVTAATGAADLYPGFTGGDVFFTITNPNPYPVTFTSMTAGTVTSSNPAACPSANVSVANASGLSLAAAASSTSGTQSIANVVTMAAGAPDGCQGATFTINLTLSGSQS
jgi:hypothetical protein